MQVHPQRSALFCLKETRQCHCEPPVLPSCLRTCFPAVKQSRRWGGLPRRFAPRSDSFLGVFPSRRGALLSGRNCHCEPGALCRVKQSPLRQGDCFAKERLAVTPSEKFLKRIQQTTTSRDVDSTEGLLGLSGCVLRLRPRYGQRHVHLHKDSPP